MDDQITKEKSLYTDVGGWICLSFVNTGSNYREHAPEKDHLDSYSDFTLWARQANLIDAAQEHALNEHAAIHEKEVAAVLARVRSVRDAMHWVFSATSAGIPVRKADLDTLNVAIAKAMGHGRLELTEKGFEWGWPAFPDELESPLWPVAKSAADLLTSEKLERVSECASDRCSWIFIDTSKNHSRRWCDMSGCGNSAKARRHYEKKRVSVNK
ncbi:MAG TPA: ABATE domain-containing protein [Chloroflexia bacterium]|nr:ABATE domain-containing protein [Chloroflexia bacterium]